MGAALVALATLVAAGPMPGALPAPAGLWSRSSVQPPSEGEEARPMFRGGPARKGSFPAPDAVGYGGVLWRAPTGGTVVSSPVVVDGAVLVGSGGGRDPLEAYLAAEHRPAATREPRPGGGAQSPDAALALYMDRMERAGFSGVVLVARGDRVLLAEGYGLADRKARIPAGPETVFSMGSITKLFTATGILRLAHQGRLSLEDSLAVFYPEAPSPHRAITIEELLTHSSGLGDLPARDVDAVERDELEARAFASELLFPPGRRYRYSNLGYSLLGAILERVSGREYEAFLRSELLIPAGIRETGYVLPDWGDGREAVGYVQGRPRGRFRDAWTGPRGPYWILRANGGLLTTVSDLHRWVQATLREEGILDPEEVEALTRPRLPITDRVHQALGWLVDTSREGDTILRHSGSNGIFSANVRHSTESSLTVVTFTNVAEFSATDLGVALERIARGEEVALPPRLDPATEVTEEDLRALAGHWRVGELGKLTLRPMGDHLEMEVEGQALLDSLLSEEIREPAFFDRMNRQTRELWEGVAAGNFGPARSILGNPDGPERPFESFLQGLTESFGPLEGVEVLGTAPAWYASPYATWVRFRFRDRDLVRRVHWNRDGGYAALGGAVYPTPLVLRCVPLAGGGCGAVHTVLPLRSVRLSAGDGREGSLEVGERRLRAERTDTDGMHPAR